MTRGGRKHLKKAALEGCPEIEEGQAVMKVVELRGSNVIEVEDCEGQKTLCLLPAKFRKSLWIKKGNYVLVDEGDRQKLLESKNKVTGTIAQVLFVDHVRILKSSSLWPSGFGEEITQTMPAVASAAHTSTVDTVTGNQVVESPVGDNSDTSKSDSEDEYGLPPLIANSNRLRGMHLCEPSSESEDESSDCEGTKEMKKI